MKINEPHYNSIQPKIQFKTKPIQDTIDYIQWVQHASSCIP